MPELRGLTRAYVNKRLRELMLEWADHVKRKTHWLDTFLRGVQGTLPLSKPQAIYWARVRGAHFPAGRCEDLAVSVSAGRALLRQLLG